jgi:hypothetical protein
LLNEKLSIEIKGSALIGKTKYEQSWRRSGADTVPAHLTHHQG